MTLKYLIDENVNSVYPQQLRRREPEIIIRVVGEPDTPKLGYNLCKQLSNLLRSRFNFS